MKRKKWISRLISIGFWLGLIGVTVHIFLTPFKGWILSPTPVNPVDLSWPWPLGYGGLVLLVLSFVLEELTKPAKKRSPKVKGPVAFDWRWDRRPEGEPATSMRPIRQA